jgi:hypothetical protein
VRALPCAFQEARYRLQRGLNCPVSPTRKIDLLGIVLAVLFWGAVAIVLYRDSDLRAWLVSTAPHGALRSFGQYLLFIYGGILKFSLLAASVLVVIWLLGAIGRFL